MPPPAIRESHHTTPTLAIYGKLPNLTGTIVLREYTSPRPLTLLPLPPLRFPFSSHPRNLDRVDPPLRRQSKRENAIIDRNISSLPPPLSPLLYRPDDFNLDPGDRDRGIKNYLLSVSHPPYYISGLSSTIFSGDNKSIVIDIGSE